MKQKIPDKGGFMYIKENKPVCWMYAKLSPDKLKSCLPLSDTSGKTHLTTFFVDNKDYLGCGIEDDIIKLIKIYGDINITNDIMPIGIWKDLYEKNFLEMKNFILNQLNSIK